MKKSILIIILLTTRLLSHAQGGIWTWVKGDSIPGGAHLDTIGVIDTASYPYGVYQAAQWTDLNGNFWIFGTGGNELWKYDPVANIWTWVNGALNSTTGVYGTKGIPGPNNLPGERTYGSSAWTDQRGRLWLNSGVGYDHLGVWGFLDDLWMYDIPTNQWTWMAGSDTANPVPHYGTKGVAAADNTQGGRSECNTAWVKSDGTFWTFGGQYGNIQNAGNDMWMYDLNTNMWTWMSGDSALSSSSVIIDTVHFGTRNIEAASNAPAGQFSYTHWQDADDNFYIFSGWATWGVFFNDVWKYNTSNNRWTWIGGDSIPNSRALYSSTCTPGSGIGPGTRAENRTAQSSGCSDIFWTFGGFFDFASQIYNDLWNFNIQTNQWTWISGDSTINSMGNYGIKGLPSLSNLPSARYGCCMWADHAGILWVWGGMDRNSHQLNDMWKFVPDTSCIHPSLFSPPISVHVSDTSLCSGQAASLTATANISGGSYSWSPTGDTTQSISVNPLNSTTYAVTYSKACGTASDSAIVTVNPLPAVT